ncbi:MAG: hypothetical protein JKY49_16170 [Cohaesibacteraceae bacterium]|nr:hypothetical protein [Cohaesibacteraceae bacterium]
MAEDLIRYDVLTQEALRNTVRKVLTEVAQTGLPGEHHFFITVDTHANGVQISSRLNEQYPDEMTIVIQHQFWDLVVGENHFEIGLSFNGIPEKLIVPLTAIKTFIDPSVQFALHFETGLDVPRESAIEDETAQAAKPKSATNLKAVSKSDDSIEPSVKEADPAADEGKSDASATDADSADVVSLDAFRKKT